MECLHSSELWLGRGAAQPHLQTAITDIKMPPGYSAGATSRSATPGSARGRRRPAIGAGSPARRPGLSKTVGGHTNNVFRKLDIGAEPAHHRRVVAVLTFLRARGA